jgi:acyl carrier protein
MDPRIVEEVATRFARIMSLDPAALDFEARLDDVYGVTSMSSMRLVSELEIELGVDIPEEEIATIGTLNDVVRLCQRHAGTVAAPAPRTDLANEPALGLTAEGRR